MKEVLSIDVCDWLNKFYGPITKEMDFPLKSKIALNQRDEFINAEDIY